MRRILVVERDAHTRAHLERDLRDEGFDVVAAADGAILGQIESTTFDLVILEPSDSAGDDELRRLRTRDDGIPVLLVSFRGDEVERASSFDSGADAYLVKPFSTLVLIAQAKALIRRSHSNRTRPSTTANNATAGLGNPELFLRRVNIGELSVDPITRRVQIRDRWVDLSNREFRLLHALICNVGIALEKDMLIKLAWGVNRARRNTVEVYIGYLRRKLAVIGADHLLTTTPGGYRLGPPRRGVGAKMRGPAPAGSFTPTAAGRHTAGARQRKAVRPPAAEPATGASSPSRPSMQLQQQPCLGSFQPGDSNAHDEQ